MDLLGQQHSQTGGVLLRVNKLELMEFRRLSPVILYSLVQNVLVQLKLRKLEGPGAYGLFLIALHAYSVKVVLANDTASPFLAKPEVHQCLSSIHFPDDLVVVAN